jgi:hypothetical protein
MSKVRFLLPGFLVLGAFGQSSQNAADPSHITKEVVQAILGNNLGQTRPTPTVPRMNYLAPLMANVPKETRCSVPLIEMNVPNGVNFTMAQVPPPQGFSDNMPVAQGLPACPTGR